MAVPSRIDEIIAEMDQDPALADALRQRILGQELAGLPEAVSQNQELIIKLMQAQLELSGKTRTALEAVASGFEKLGPFIAAALAEQTQGLQRAEEFIADQRQFNTDQGEFNTDQRQFIAEQGTRTANIEVRLTRIEGDSGSLKGYFARNETVADASGIAEDMGLEYVATLTGDELRNMSTGKLDRNVSQSFRRADLVIQTTDGTETRYIAMEISYTANLRDCTRATRNAELLTRFTGRPAVPAIASVRNDHGAQEQVDSGKIHWHLLEDRTPDPE
jgi:hypothetical protein